MLRNIGLLTLIAMLAATVAAYTAVQAAPNPEAGNVSDAPTALRTITVVGEGEVSLKPDIAAISVGAEARAETVSQAKAEVDAKMETIAIALREAGVAEKDIQASHYGIHYEREPMSGMRNGPAAETHEEYVVSSMVRVTVRNVEKAGDVLDGAVQAGANQVYGVTFTASDESAWTSRARADAMADARSRALELAGLADAELGEVLSVSEVVGGIPVTLKGISSQMGGGVMAPGELEFSTQIQVTFAVQ